MFCTGCISFHLLPGSYTVSILSYLYLHSCELFDRLSLLVVRIAFTLFAHLPFNLEGIRFPYIFFFWFIGGFAPFLLRGCPAGRAAFLPSFRSKSFLTDFACCYRFYTVLLCFIPYPAVCCAFHLCYLFFCVSAAEFSELFLRYRYLARALYRLLYLGERSL